MAEGLNSDSWRISDATRYGSSPFFADSVLIVSHHASGKQNAPVGQRNRIDGRRRRIRQRALQRAHGAKGLAKRGIDLRLGQRAPTVRIRIRRNLLRDVIVQPRIGHQARLGNMRAVGRKRVGEMRNRRRP